ncbi:MAG: hypothetical protein OXC37_01795 [Bdellovibrionaceae bacterium]|nr:hypothetical protein [Pseudobdellovibrionaceae bacterium]
MRFLVVLFFCFPLLCSSYYTAKTLKLKEYTEMRDIVEGYIKKSREKAPQNLVSEGGEEALSELKKGLKVLLMRPDTDNINSSLLLMIQDEIVTHRDFMPVFAEVVEKSIKEFRSKTFSLSQQAGLLYVIENSISYLQSVNTKESTKILMDIKKADLKISEKLSNYLILEMDRGKTSNPSYLAERVLIKRKQENALAEKQKKAEEEKKRQAEAEKESDTKRNPSSEQKIETSDKITLEIEL